jgi:hypothetical protein
MYTHDYRAKYLVDVCAEIATAADVVIDVDRNAL